MPNACVPSRSAVGVIQSSCSASLENLLPQAREGTLEEERCRGSGIGLPRVPGAVSVRVWPTMSRGSRYSRLPTTNPTALAEHVSLPACPGVSTSSTTTSASAPATPEVTRIEDDVWERIITVNMKSVIKPCNHVVPVMRPVAERRNPHYLVDRCRLRRRLLSSQDLEGRGECDHATSNLRATAPTENLSRRRRFPRCPIAARRRPRMRTVAPAGL